MLGSVSAASSSRRRASAATASNESARPSRYAAANSRSSRRLPVRAARVAPLPPALLAYLGTSRPWPGSAPPLLPTGAPRSSGSVCAHESHRRLRSDAEEPAILQGDAGLQSRPHVRHGAMEIPALPRVYSEEAMVVRSLMGVPCGLQSPHSSCIVRHGGHVSPAMSAARPRLADARGQGPRITQRLPAAQRLLQQARSLPRAHRPIALHSPAAYGPSATVAGSRAARPAPAPPRAPPAPARSLPAP